MKNAIEKQGTAIEKPVATPKREFKTLLSAFLVMATAGTVLGGAEEAKAQTISVCRGNLLNCLNPKAFHQFQQAGFDLITPSFGEQVGPGTPGTPGFVDFGDPRWPVWLR